MNTQTTRHLPSAINLHQKSRILTIEFDHEQRFELPCEYLRIFSKAAEVQALDQPVTGKEGVNIVSIEPQGNYAVRLVFDDGHDTGIYSWDSLYQLGLNYAQNWQEYLQKLHNIGHKRQIHVGKRRIKILYFAHLAHKLRLEAETVDLPEYVVDITALLVWLGQRKAAAAPLFASDQIKATVNRQFAESFTKLEDGDEVGLVPNSPIAPPTPDLV